MDDELVFILNTYTNNLPPKQAAFDALKANIIPFEPYATKALRAYPIHADNNFFDLSLVFKLIRRFMAQAKEWPVDENEAYSQLQKAIRYGDAELLSLPVKETVAGNGGFRYFRESTNAVADRANFKKAYPTILHNLLTTEMETLANV